MPQLDGTGEATSTEEQGQESAEQKVDTSEQVSVISNSEAKKLPWVREMAAKLKALETRETERAEADKKAKADAELEKATAAKDYEKALELQKATSLEEINTLKSNALNAEMKAELLSKGAQLTDGLLKVAVAEYDPEKFESIADFATSLKEDDVYKSFFSDSTTREVKEDLPGSKVTGGKTDWNQVKAWEKSNDRAERQKAREILADYRKVHNKYPY